MLLAVDPGKRACGCALFRSGTKELARAALVDGAEAANGPEAWVATAIAVARWASPGIEAVVIERPGAYGRDLPSRTLNLQELVAVGAAVCALFPDAVHIAYFPRDWEGALKRPASHREADPVAERVRGRLSPGERARVLLPAPSRAHNVWDAVGIGLKALGRFEPQRVYARGGGTDRK